MLLPGMDGSGSLFKDFIAALPEDFETQVVCYPPEVNLFYADLAAFLMSTIAIQGSFVLIAESFSTPLAVQYAAKNPPNLRGVVLCSGFATSPVKGWRRDVYLSLSSLLFSITPPRFAIKHLLIGGDASPSSGRAVLSCDARDELRRIVVPILLLQPKRDRFIGAASSNEIYEIMPSAIVEQVDGPYLLLQKQPKQTAEIIANFCRIAGSGISFPKPPC